MPVNPKTANIEYLPYGELFFERRDIWNTPYKFNAKELDAELRSNRRIPLKINNQMRQTGMYYYGARYYTPEVSIWLSVDPLADKYPSMSPYMYCAGNPMRYIDPDGRSLTDFGLTEDGKIIQIGETNDDPDRLFVYDKESGKYKYITVKDKNLLPELSENKEKAQTDIDAEGNVGQEGTIRTAQTSNVEDAGKLLSFMGKYSKDEWAVYALDGGSYKIGTLGLDNFAPSLTNMGIDNPNKVKRMIHTHTFEKNNSAEVDALYGDYGAVMNKTVTYDYYTYYSRSKNLYQIHKYSRHTVQNSIIAKDIIKLLKK